MGVGRRVVDIGGCFTRLGLLSHSPLERPALPQHFDDIPSVLTSTTFTLYSLPPILSTQMNIA